jgi:hypothetical protein
MLEVLGILAITRFLGRFFRGWSSFSSCKLILKMKRMMIVVVMSQKMKDEDRDMEGLLLGFG